MLPKIPQAPCLLQKPLLSSIVSCGQVCPPFSPGQRLLLAKSSSGSSEPTSQLDLDLGPILARLQSPVLASFLSQFRENPSTLNVWSPRPASSKSPAKSFEQEFPDPWCLLVIFYPAPLSLSPTHSLALNRHLSLLYSELSLISPPIALVLTPIKRALSKVFLPILTTVRIILSSSHLTHYTANPLRSGTMCRLGPDTQCTWWPLRNVCWMKIWKHLAERAPAAMHSHSPAPAESPDPVLCLLPSV